MVSVTPAKELRARVRRKGVASTTDDYKAGVLKAYIEQRIDEEKPNRVDAWLTFGAQRPATPPLGDIGDIDFERPPWPLQMTQARLYRDSGTGLSCSVRTPPRRTQYRRWCRSRIIWTWNSLAE